MERMGAGRVAESGDARARLSGIYEQDGGEGGEIFERWLAI